MEFTLVWLFGFVVGFLLGGLCCYSAFEDEIKGGIVIVRKVYYRTTRIDPHTIPGEGT